MDLTNRPKQNCHMLLLLLLLARPPAEEGNGKKEQKLPSRNLTAARLLRPRGWHARHGTRWAAVAVLAVSLSLPLLVPFGAAQQEIGRRFGFTRARARHREWRFGNVLTGWIRRVTRRQVRLLRNAVHDGARRNARPIQEANGRGVSFYYTSPGHGRGAPGD
ncbi:alpha carbonic anhydrase 7-like isoform X2 [Panicum miliaceum]|uniref:Alpha carbonic anhydrase 7-like isoform X2 n=1 Tax=Panicum miliaceum TaxID=4540 RepID=A0A3L6PEH2_PANMI|nr:alpha carbonic anhydrase 7-like isoform X2 [Panicum miliaceum]